MMMTEMQTQLPDHCDRTSACTGRAYAVRRFREVIGIHGFFSRR